jgi:hypothetical protein
VAPRIGEQTSAWHFYAPVSPYPQLRDLLVTDASTCGTLVVVTGPSGGDKAEAGQQLLDRALIEYGHVFTTGPRIAAALRSLKLRGSRRRSL